LKRIFCVYVVQSLHFLDKYLIYYINYMQIIIHMCLLNTWPRRVSLQAYQLQGAEYASFKPVQLILKPHIAIAGDGTLLPKHVGATCFNSHM
jgi:hypothetical protein